MASTLLDVVSSALTEIGQLGQGQTASPEDGAIGLRQANLLLSQKSTQRLFLSYVAIREYVLSATADYTIGPTGATFTAPRPTLIESAQIKVGSTNVWLPISVWDKAKWDGIVNKGATADIPEGVYPEYTFPNMGFHVHPIPIGAPSIRLGAWEQLTQFATLFDQVLFPPAYEAWLEAALAIILAPFYDQPITQSMADRGAETLADLQRYNAQSLGGAVSANQQMASPNVGQPIPSAPPTAPGQ